MVFSRSRASGSGNGGVVSPGDGKVTDVAPYTSDGERRTRISIFLNVFDVHVNRSPIAGIIRDVRYQRGKFLNAMAANSADENEQNIVTVDGEGQTVIFKQIAGLIARRIVSTQNRRPGRARPMLDSSSLDRDGRRCRRKRENFGEGWRPRQGR
jgi:phosphatidylserine decarboxylase precursor-related protein